MRTDCAIRKLILRSILPRFERFHCFQRIKLLLNTSIHLSKLKPRLLTVMYTPGRWCGLLVNCLISIVYKICIAAYWILYSEFGRVSCIDLFSTLAMDNLDVK